MGLKFEDMDILDSLGRIVELNTHHYKDDFDLDKELIPKLAVSEDPEDRRLLWMSRPCGTYTLREREAYLEGSYENNVWRFYHEQTRDTVLAYALVLKGVQDGKVAGDIYPLDYAAHVEQVKRLTCPIEKVEAVFADGERLTLPYHNHKALISVLAQEHGRTGSVRYEPESSRELSVILERERFKRSYHAVPGDMGEYMDGLKKGTLRGRLKEAQAAAASSHRPATHRKEPER